ncbi:tyrosine-type recombinase/integrase [Microbaculum marinisediminis]|uniref:Site-specific integrase n=1 Tax=Microbaculum marinisediminis TaxID=2931392 RepID=A0AAW5R1D4_9HYPH|nr:site-specific integrase [Microbaculum sp. A6E488]MCT8972478.1 site-specific integrase [Microbaculum sp. A6E488]
MRKHHPRNERIKRRYFAYLEEAKRMKPSSVDQVAAAIAVFEASTGWRDFRNFHIEQARKFKRDLAQQMNPATGKPLAKATVYSRLMALRAFFLWLAGQPGYRSCLAYADADYFNPSANDSRVATATRQRPVPTVEQVKLVLDTMSSATEIQHRDRALIAFTLLTGARDDAIASLSLKHVDLERRSVFQDAREVRTKNAKTFTSWFFPVGEDVEAVVSDWIAWLRREKHFGEDDPLFPATKIGLNADGHFASVGLDRKHWKNAHAIRRIFKSAFESAGLDYFHPHSFRKTLARLGEQICPTAEAFKAWSQNLGHESVMTTFRSYGEVQPERQAEIIRSLATRPPDGQSTSPGSQLVPVEADKLNRLFAKLGID